MRISRDFLARAEVERNFFLRDTWCNICNEADLGMNTPSEYEENGHVFVEGRCNKCGAPVTSEVIERAFKP